VRGEAGDVFADLLRAAHADDRRRDRRVPQRELEGGGGQRDAVPGAGVAHQAGAGEHGGRGRGVVVGAGVVRAGQDAAVEHAGRQHRYAAPLAHREQLGRGRLVEQRVPARDQHAVQVAALGQPGQGGRGVHPGPDGPDHALVAEGRQRRVGLVGRLRHEVVGVVDEHDVHPVEPEPFQALRQAAPHAVPAVVTHPGQRRDAVEPGLALDVPGRGHQQPADLGGDGELVPGASGQERAEPPLGQADAVVRRGVERPDARGPGRGQRRGGDLVADRRVHPGDGCAAEHERPGDQAGQAGGGAHAPIFPSRQAGPDG
jgi:hypothetical protein